MPPRLAARLRQGTAALHREAEDTELMRALFAGRVDRTSYLRLLRGLYPVYRELEDALRRHPAACPLPLHLIARAPAIEADLATLHGPGWASRLPPVAEGEAYASRVRAVAESEPMLLAAHAYVRYLGDLSGGQMMGEVVARGLALPDAAGVAFYRFAALPGAAEGRRAFRAGLDALPGTEAETARLVEEARWAFTANLRLFAAVTPAPSPRTSPSAG
jgi:heme oxygenase